MPPQKRRARTPQSGQRTAEIGSRKPPRTNTRRGQSTTGALQLQTPRDSGFQAAASNGDGLLKSPYALGGSYAAQPEAPRNQEFATVSGDKINLFPKPAAGVSTEAAAARPRGRRHQIVAAAPPPPAPRAEATPLTGVPRWTEVEDDSDEGMSSVEATHAAPSSGLEMVDARRAATADTGVGATVNMDIVSDAAPAPPCGGRMFEMCRVGDATSRRFGYQKDAAKAFGISQGEVSQLLNNRATTELSRKFEARYVEDGPTVYVCGKGCGMTFNHQSGARSHSRGCDGVRPKPASPLPENPSELQIFNHRLQTLEYVHGKKSTERRTFLTEALGRFFIHSKFPKEKDQVKVLRGFYADLSKAPKNPKHKAPQPVVVHFVNDPQKRWWFGSQTAASIWDGKRFKCGPVDIWSLVQGKKSKATGRVAARLATQADLTDSTIIKIDYAGRVHGHRPVGYAAVALQDAKKAQVAHVRAVEQLAVESAATDERIQGHFIGGVFGPADADNSDDDLVSV